jgi:magnesium-transporting ATPase (P-type)
LLAVASGSAFATIACAQMANAFACRSETVAAWRLPLLRNRLVLWAVAAELALLLLFLGVPALADLLGGAWPSLRGWLWAISGAALLLLADGLHKSLGGSRPRPPGRRRRSGHASAGPPAV